MMRPDLAAQIRLGLTCAQKTLPSAYLYDAAGSALFEAITHCPEYGLARADERIVREHAPDVVQMVSECETVIELGSGSGRKTKPVLAQLNRPRYVPIDISPEALKVCAGEMEAVARVEPICSDYLSGVARATSGRNGARVLTLFLGSTIGNFSREEGKQFLRQLRSMLRPGDGLLLGADLVKDPSALLEAYDDPAGLTAAFNKNLLARINRELDADFDIRQFAHEARYSPPLQRVEMHLRSLRAQTVTLRAIDLEIHFEPDETIWTESSYKYTIDDLQAMAAAAGWDPRAVWTDAEWPFAENLWIAA